MARRGRPHVQYKVVTLEHALPTHTLLCENIAAAAAEMGCSVGYLRCMLTFSQGQPYQRGEKVDRKSTRLNSSHRV